mmetsp:Transcript_20246/g.44205  ORF Transcript_20246/g.44205 Transcript_20246/m.44205 type:complete len:379 (+) Transcript_20246:415-1551(+)
MPLTDTTFALSLAPNVRTTGTAFMTAIQLRTCTSTPTLQCHSTCSVRTMLPLCSTTTDLPSQRRPYCLSSAGPPVLPVPPPGVPEPDPGGLLIRTQLVGCSTRACHDTGSTRWDHGTASVQMKTHPSRPRPPACGPLPADQRHKAASSCPLSSNARAVTARRARSAGSTCGRGPDSRSERMTSCAGSSGRRQVSWPLLMSYTSTCCMGVSMPSAWLPLPLWGLPLAEVVRWPWCTGVEGVSGPGSSKVGPTATCIVSLCTATMGSTRSKPMTKETVACIRLGLSCTTELPNAGASICSSCWACAATSCQPLQVAISLLRAWRSSGCSAPPATSPDMWLRSAASSSGRSRRAAAESSGISWSATWNTGSRELGSWQGCV